MSEEIDNEAPKETLSAATPAPDVPSAESEAAPPAATDAESAAGATPPAGAETVPAPEPDASGAKPDATGPEETPVAPDGQPRWYAKGRKAIPGKLFPSRIKSDGVKAWTISFYAVLIGLVLWMFSMAHGWACGPLAIAGLVGLYYALLAAKRTPDASRKIAISIGMLGLVSLVFVLGGCELEGIHRESDWDALREKQFSAEEAVDTFVESLSKTSENQ